MVSVKIFRAKSHVFIYEIASLRLAICNVWWFCARQKLLISNFKFLFSPSFVLNRSFVLLFFFLLCVLLSHCLGLLFKLLSLEPGDRGGGKKLWIMILQIPDHPCDNAQITVVLREKCQSYHEHNLKMFAISGTSGSSGLGSASSTWYEIKIRLSQ